ncbi:DUF5127 domain-containing protein [uncultured Metabacillus sp.]|uniref:DUF5127 domain-containing protein n=1 Tax=uncultured Metabacillus sp. TaxID=2860135 RepID=UPI002621B3EC|nr:DUF5127 domain-containing protein [uncultured Metabacillus sp.]
MINRDRSEERIGFQESSPYKPTYDLQTDFVMVYGIDRTMPERIKAWKEKGYVVHLMTGVAWGEYQDYLYGKIDGRNHWDEAQKNKHDSYIQHGKDVPYMVPTISYTNFLTERIRAAVDAGVEAIHLEEPEFWADGGYSEAFKREWQIYYKEPWQSPHESVDAEYRASHLKAYLYKRALDRLCSELKEYALVKYNRFLRFYVPTHSLINYTQWRIISPESMLIDLPAIDGYIAQIWTGTSRTPNVYEGVRKERTFETAFLEYGMMQELVSGTDRRMWFLHDPIEDNPRHTWSDYRRNYYKTVVASLLHPEISHFEISPWPKRIFEGKYPKEDGTGVETIPEDYATNLLSVMHTLGNMDQQDIHIHGNAEKIGVLVADSMMYQRRNFSNEENESNARYDGTDPDSVGNEEDIELLNFSHFYGLALPLLKRGLWVRPVQLDNVRRFSNYLKDYRLLILSYEFLKPEYPDLHNALAQWVKEGGVLIYVGDDRDPYHKVREWWNTGKHQYKFPREHLFECLGLVNELDQGMHWTNKRNSKVGMIVVDGKTSRFMGKIEMAPDAEYEEPPAFLQKSLKVEPLTTTYLFEGDGIELEVKFMTPLLLNDLDLLSRPASYITFNVRSIDGNVHDVKIYFDVSGDLCVNTADQPIVWDRKLINGQISAMYMGTEEQPILRRVGDDTRIDWGYCYLASPQVSSIKTVIHSYDVRKQFVETRQLLEKDDEQQPRPVQSNPAVMAVQVDIGEVDETQVSHFLVLAYDDIHSIEYFGKPLSAYWRRNGMTFEEMITLAITQYEEIQRKCEEFNRELIKWDFLNESPSRVPFTDWYDTITGKQINFQNRSVVGGLFIKFLTPVGMES